MGIYIDFYAVPSMIRSSEWAAAFDDALKLAQAGKLCDLDQKSVDGHTYLVGVPAALDPPRYNVPGVMICGELLYGTTMESHFIPRSFGVKRPKRDPRESIIAAFLDNPEDYGIEPPDLRGILYNQTQGNPAHIWLLAMACVFIDHFPDAAFVMGDITAGQVHRALELASEVLGREIALPLVYDMRRLLEEIHRYTDDPYAALCMYFKCYRGLRDEDFNRFVVERFSKDDLYRRYCAEANKWELHRVLKEWLLLGLPFRDAARMLVTDPEGPQHSPEEFVTAVLDSKLHQEKKYLYDAAFTDERNDEPDNVMSFLMRAWVIMRDLRNWAIDRYIPMEQLKADCGAVFGDRCDVDALFSDTAARLEADERRQKAKQVYDNVEEKVAAHREYTYPRMKDMRFWQPDKADEAAPELYDTLEQFVRRAYESSAEYREKFLASERAARIAMLISLGGNKFLLSEEAWQKLFDNVMDDGAMEQIFTLFSVETENSNVAEAANILLRNEALYGDIWRRVFGEG